MSQITRCPSCATAFRVVADQLRISDGWVRCGQCKEVFDASAHLLPAPPASLLPGVSLTDTRPPLAPVARQEFSQRAWGDTVAPSRQESEGYLVQPAAMPVAQDDAPNSAQQVSDRVGVAPVTEPVLDVPEPAVPAFLAAGNNEPQDDVARLGALAPYAWRSQRTSSAEHSTPSLFADMQGAESAEGVFAPVPSLQSSTAVSLPEDLHAQQISGANSLETRWPGFPPVQSVAPLLDGEPQRNRMSSRDEEHAIAEELTPEGYPPLELPTKPESTPDSEGKATSHGDSIEAGVPDRDALGLAAPASPDIDAELLSLLEDDGFSTPLPSSSSRIRPSEPTEAAADTADDEAHDQVSFVVAARRRAFWRKPAVRGLLLLTFVASSLGLALQVTLQERDRIAAIDERLQPWLVTLCGYLECEVAPRRQISDVVIESSSFNKARGDSYQLAITLKSTAGVALSVPAVELTLTDVQDQAVVRRVFLPADLGAPSALPARGEWSTSVTVAVTTGGARVAGYRVLAFYP